MRVIGAEVGSRMGSGRGVPRSVYPAYIPGCTYPPWYTGGYPPGYTGRYPTRVHESVTHPGTWECYTPGYTAGYTLGYTAGYTPRVYHQVTHPAYTPGYTPYIYTRFHTLGGERHLQTGIPTLGGEGATLRRGTRVLLREEGRLCAESSLSSLRN